MLTRKTVGAVLMVATVIVVPAASFARDRQADCPFHEHQIASVRSFEVEQPALGKATVKRLLGVEIYVNAEPGLTAEWLQTQLMQRIAQMRPAPSVYDASEMKDCPLDVTGLSVQVTPAGTGFWVKLIARNPEQAKEVLRRAHVLFG